MNDTTQCKEFDLTGKVAVVTGAGRGLGRGMALDLARYGADVVLCSRTRSELESVAEEIEALDRRAMVRPVDVGQVADLEAMAREAADAFGRIDILVNNAGLNVPQWAEEVTEEAWDRVMAINLKGAFFCAQAVGRVMIEQKHGKIINISSQAGSVGLIKRAAYCASKGAINQLTRVLAVEWAKHGICVNALGPTFVETDMTRKMFEDASFSHYVNSNILLDRLANPGDLTGALILLASGASDMITGHILHIDGGWTAH
jgi:NAD(P)-dependent dehydrogenase (short-subunit alcohol dehydrogenase family)